MCFSSLILKIFNQIMNFKDIQRDLTMLNVSPWNLFRQVLSDYMVFDLILINLFKYVRHTITTSSNIQVRQAKPEMFNKRSSRLIYMKLWSVWLVKCVTN